MKKRRTTIGPQSPHNRNGFTLAELLIATMILGMIISFSASIYFSFFSSIRNLKAANNIYEEARFMMERIVKEVRSGTIDYEEYYNDRYSHKLGQNYCSYHQQFYDSGEDGMLGTTDDNSLGFNNDDLGYSALASSMQDELYLINGNGDRRTYLKRFITDSVSTPSGTVDIGKIALLKMDGKDWGLDHLTFEENRSDCPIDEGEGDNRIDTWVCADGFSCSKVAESLILPDNSTCNGDRIEIIDDKALPGNINTSSFVDITPRSINIVDLQFIIEPLEDPRKAYADPLYQIQPHVTIKMVVESHPSLTSEFKGQRPRIVLESTVTSRLQEEVVTECNIKQCTSGATRACPLQQGVCGDQGSGPLEETCAVGIWPGCAATDYVAWAGASTYNPIHSNYQHETEFAACLDGPCKEAFCSDNLDNDCDGKEDMDDEDCVFEFCSNSMIDLFLPLGDECAPGIGPACAAIHSYEPAAELSCYDGYDNDCGNGGADEFDNNCKTIICDNGLEDPTIGNDFADSSYLPTNYLVGVLPVLNDQDEICTDVGGLCNGMIIDGVDHSKVGTEGATLCYDGLDNDCNGQADEFDSNCLEEICDNGNWDQNLASSGFTPDDYLKEYKDNFGGDSTDQDEVCTDVGGLCEGQTIPAVAGKDHSYLASGEKDTGNLTNWQYLCTDGLDNDCDGNIDLSDTDCCIDQDNDGYPLHVDFIQSCPIAGKETTIDCDDNDSDKNPGLSEICDDGKDNDCDGGIDEADCV